MFSLPKELSSFIKDILRFLTHNFWLKFLSLVFSFVLFFIVRTDKETVFEKTVKIKIVTLSNMTVIGSNERYLTASIKIQNAFLSIPPTDNELTGEVDVTNNTVGKINIRVTKENFPHLPKNYFLFIDKPYIEVDLDKVVEKNLEIKPILIGKPLLNYTISKIKIYPKNVLFSGGSRDLEKINFINTVPINIDGIKETLTTDVLLDVKEKASVKSDIKFVNVVIDVNKK